MNCSHFLAGFQTGNRLYKSHDLGWTSCSLGPSPRHANEPQHLIEVVLRAHRFLTWEVFAFLQQVFISLAAPWLRCLVWGLALRLTDSSCGAALSTWNLSSRSGMEPASPALQGGFLTTGPPGQSQHGDASRERKQMGLSFSRMACSLELL